ncbi:MAG: PAS domain-containing protein [Acidobacteriota bacterium]
MKYHVAPTNQFREMREEDFIVSKTDLKGRITYCNKIFIEFSKYSADELIGVQHNIVRHPFMPRSVFKMLWDTIQNRGEIFAYILNMAKDGSGYWVFANVAESTDETGRPIAYYSVRRKPKAAGVKAVTEIYREMTEIERRVGTKDGMAASAEFFKSIYGKGGMTYEEFVHTL